ELDLDAADSARGRERRGLRRDALGGEDAAAQRSRGIDADALQVAAELLDRVDRSHALDLDRDPRSVLVAAHEVDGAEIRLPLAANEAQRLAERLRSFGQRLLEMPFDAVLLQPALDVELHRDVAEDLGDRELEPILGGARALAYDDPADRVSFQFDRRRRRHPVQRLD